VSTPDVTYIAIDDTLTNHTPTPVYETYHTVTSPRWELRVSSKT
jgi:hypothetical protein